MSSRKDYNYDASFDCSFYLGHGIVLPHNDEGYHLKLNPAELIAYADSFVTDGDEKNYNFSAMKLKQFDLAESSRRNSTEDYYPMEYSNLVSCMKQSDLEDFTMTGNEFNLIHEISAAEDALLPISAAPYDGDGVEMIEDLMHRAGASSLEQLFWKNMEKKDLFDDVEWYKRELMEKSSHQSSLQFQNMVDEYLKGFGENRIDNWGLGHSNASEDQTRKRRLCRHFLKGHCKRGNACDFLHDLSIFCPNSQKVFLGGLPANITEVTLRQKLAEQGYEVINKPKVLRGFTPQVCMASVEEAQKLIEKRNILIEGSLVDVRAYEAFAKGDIDKIRPDEIKRSVFLGGLSRGTTSQMIKDDLEKMDVKIVNHPIVKTGFTPKVTLATVEESNMLIKLKKVRINDTLVDVRPYINYKSPFRSHRKN